MMLLAPPPALLPAEKKFRCINGCEQLKDLEKFLRGMETDSTLKAA
jgi:hypothetical protein